MSSTDVEKKPAIPEESKKDASTTDSKPVDHLDPKKV